jgi:acyl-coenzyme A synthetase/AMP-(fatty) acid ligase
MSIVENQVPFHFNMAAYCLAQAAHETPDKPALVVIDNVEAEEPAETWTFAELEDAVLRAAAALEDKGFKRGSHVLIRLDNTSTYAIFYFAIIAAGLVAVPTSSQLTAAEAKFLLEDCEASAVALAAHLSLPDCVGVKVFSEDDVRAMLGYPRRAGYADTRPEDPAYLLYTSGTTARPKGVVHAHRVAIGRQPNYTGWYGITANDRMLHAGAFNWTYTLGTGLIDPWANGATSIIYTGKKTPEVWPRLIVKTGATQFAAVPSLFRQILKYAPPGRIGVGRLRHALTAGEGPPATLFDEWQERTGTPLLEALGMTEISTYISTAPGMPRKPGSAGKPQPGRRIAILPVEGGTESLPPGKEGLLAVHRSNPGLMLGYWKRPEEEAAAYRGEWFIGGDLAVMDEDGYVTHLGRNNDVMKALGYRVSPLEVESVLAQHPDVAEVACTEVPVRDDVTVIGAFIVPRGTARPDPENIKAFAAERLARYKCPREIVLVDTLPRTANGKVKRTALVRAFVARTKQG